MTDSRFTESFEPRGASSGAVRLFAPGTELSERYEVREVLGTGGFAVVYRAWDRTLQREVALKVLRPDRMGTEALRRFRREVALARDVESPRLVRIFDIEETAETVYYSMELVEGESLREKLRRGPLPVTECVRIVGQVLEALRALHGAGVVHRDLKPGNVLLTEGGDVKLCDLGLARELDGGESMTATDAVVGTLDYLAPEQALGRDADARTDLYGLGCVLFEMLTGQVPHKSKTSVGTLVAHVQDTAPRVRTLSPDVPPFVDAFVARLLERKPADRYGSADAALFDLARERVRRGPSPRSLAAGVVVAVLVLAAGFAGVRRTRALPRVAWEETTGLRAFDGNGHVLWQADDIYSSSRYAIARLKSGGAPNLVAIRGRGDDLDPARMNVLSILDPWTGRLERTVRLPSGALYFKPFGERFGAAAMSALDLDGDRVDEIAVTYTHSPYYPSYTVVWEPVLDRARVVFLGSGHHYVLGAVDLDGDGRRELILGGPSNRLGQSAGVAAVRLVPPVGVPGESTTTSRCGTPDQMFTGQGGSVAWYALAPMAVFHPLEGFDVDPARRWMRIRPPRAAPIELDFDGFAPGSGSKEAATARQAARWDCYDRLRDAMPLVERFDGEGALRLLAPASAAAAAAGDARLAEWVSRVETRALVAAGHDGEARARLEGFAASSSSPMDALLDGANAFHVRGALAEAIHWYGRALQLPAGDEVPRGRSLVAVEGELLALSELGEWGVMNAEIETARRTNQSANWVPVYREWMRWRMGLRPHPSILASVDLPNSPDAFRYWMLEMKIARGDAPATLMADTDALVAGTSDSPSLPMAFRAELLARAGRVKEALEAMRAAFPVAVADARREPLTRAHLDLVARRYAAIAGKANAPDEKAEAQRVLARIESERARERALFRSGPPAPVRKSGANLPPPA